MALITARVFVALLTAGLGPRVQPELKHEPAKSGANTSVAACVDADSSFCRSDNVWYYQSGQCCTKDNNAYVTCKKASDSSFCKGPDWKYMGLGQCCTTLLLPGSRALLRHKPVEGVPDLPDRHRYELLQEGLRLGVSR
ncbi:unnamed protein product [Symbiodinium sp. CCMP2456]|nr:unnamed protein product [Symbiodinium sp. CCMP2456]